MTSTPITDLVSRFAKHHAKFGRHWTKFDQILLPLDDGGFRQGVTVVERLRTYQARPFEIPRHAVRWAQSLADLRMDCEITENRFGEFVDQLVDRNLDLIKDLHGNVGITLFATPDCCAVHLNLINDHQVDERLASGQPLVVTAYQSPPSQSWPRRAKVRSRIHYYLADLDATQLDPQAIGLLVDNDQSVTETSVANIAIVEEGEIISPRRDQVLAGVTQQVVEGLASHLLLSWRHEPISVERLRKADEVLLMGTDTGVWFANQLFTEQPTQAAGGVRTRGPLCERLQNAFLDYVKSCL